jgi:hypothetical protein
MAARLHMIESSILIIKICALCKAPLPAVAPVGHKPSETSFVHFEGTTKTNVEIVTGHPGLVRTSVQETEVASNRKK